MAEKRKEASIAVNMNFGFNLIGKKRNLILLAKLINKHLIFYLID